MEKMIQEAFVRFFRQNVNVAKFFSWVYAYLWLLFVTANRLSFPKAFVNAIQNANAAEIQAHRADAKFSFVIQMKLLEWKIWSSFSLLHKC